VRIVSVPWHLQGVRGNVVKISWTLGGCLTPPDRIHLVQTSRFVKIAVLAHLYVPGGASCAADAFAGLKLIRLLEPLGNRKLIHARVTPHVGAGAPAAG
jgi:hypothetical protein